MTSARDIMTPNTVWIDTGATVAEAAQRLSSDDLGALPICDGEGHLQGMVTDRDIVVKVVAQGRDPESTRVEELADVGEVVTIGADDSVDEAIETMKMHRVRRLPVIDGHDLVGMLSQADIARQMPDRRIADLVSTISETPPNN